jgi:signal transduction histidine kinase/DNA-binding NarL/FixJ family response regulator
MRWIKANIESDSDARELMVTTFRHLVSALAILYGCWHFIATLSWPDIFSPSLWRVTFLILGMTVVSLYLIKRSYLLSHIVWHVGLVSAVIVAYGLYERQEIILVLTFLPLMSVFTMGRVGTFIAESLVITSIIIMQRLTFLSPLDAAYSTGITLGSLFFGFFGWGLYHNMLSTLSSASYHFHQAQNLLNDTRRHRGEISQILKERNHATYQLERLSQMLQHARKKAEEAHDDRNRFVLAVSHELRSPLNFILGFSDLMANSPETYADLENWPPGLFDDVKEIYRSSSHLMNLINDILDLGQIDAQQMTLYREQASIDLLVNEVIRMAKPAFAQKGLSLNAILDTDLPPVFVDITRLRQVLLNLVNNGLRFTDSGGVTVRVEKQPDALLISVEDTGTGIAKDDIAKVFEAFRQVGQDSWRRREGSGLGLAISHRFVELHGGKMWLESELGRGSRFFFSIPTIDSQQVLDLEDSPNWRSIPRMHETDHRPLALLLAQDSLTGRVIQQSLDWVKIVFVDDLADLPEMVAQLYPQALFVDKSIPLDGRIRLRDLPYDLPVIGINLPGMLDGFTSLPHNVHDYLVKPVSRNTLIEAVQRLGVGVSRILIVDDDPAMVRFVTQTLKATAVAPLSSVEYELIGAYTGQEALDILQTRPVDAILLDLDLPDITGWEVLSALTDDEKFVQIPVIIISAVDLPQVLYTHGRQVFDVMMRRPFSKQEMSAVLNAILENIKPIYPRITDPNGQVLQKDPAA